MDPDGFHSCCYCQECSEITVYHNCTVLLAWLASGCTWQDDKRKNNSCGFSSTLLVTLSGAVFCYIMRKPATWQSKCITKYNSGGFKSLLFVTLSKGHFVTLCGKPPPSPGSCPKLQALFLSEVGPCFRSGDHYDIISCMVTNCRVHRTGKEFQYKPPHTHRTLDTGA